VPDVGIRVIELSRGSALNADLVLLAVGGVQPFIAESRKTADAAGASLAVRQVVAAAASRAVAGMADQGEPYGLVMPDPGVLTDSGGRVPVGISNKIVFLAPVGTGVPLAEGAAEAARREWARLVARTHGSEVDTPGMPDLTWVCVTGDVGGDAGYQAVWQSAKEALEQRKRARWFAVSRTTSRALCAQSPLLPAVDVPSGPGGMGVPQHERRERLSAAGWVKRYLGNKTYGPGERFPSTAVVASSSFRARLVRRAAENAGLRDELTPLVARLAGMAPAGDVDHAPLPGATPAELGALSTRLGVLISPDAWEAGVLRDEFGDGAGRYAAAGRGIAGRIGKLAERHDVSALTPYYAILVQDLDRLGKRLGGLSLADQRAASGVLTELGRRQRELSRQAGHLGVPVFAGGDDFLAFVPAATALPLAAQLRRLTGDHLRDTPSLTGVTASTAVVFCHLTGPLREAIATAQRALDRAKEARGTGYAARRNALTVVVLRRGGERARTVQPWYPAGGRNAVELLCSAAPDARFSGRLAGRLERDRDELNRLAGHSRAAVRVTAHDEVRRLVSRQGGSAEVAEAVITLGEHERRPPDEDPRFDPVPATLVARFLAQECR
jgi:CRISPR-associated protein Cmr2